MDFPVLTHPICNLQMPLNQELVTHKEEVTRSLEWSVNLFTE